MLPKSYLINYFSFILPTDGLNLKTMYNDSMNGPLLAFTSTKYLIHL